MQFEIIGASITATALSEEEYSSWLESVQGGNGKELVQPPATVRLVVYRILESCPWNSDQNCTQNSARGWVGVGGGGSGVDGGQGGWGWWG